MDSNAWLKNGILGIQAIDADHANIASAMDLLIMRISANSEKSAIASAANDLVDLASSHFEMEEGMMFDVRYGGREIHAAAHRMLMREISLLIRHHLSKDILTITVDDVDALRSWVANHILTFDLEFAKYYKSMLAPES
jgi:hemerythrin-like metal-binding protein